MLRRFDVAQMQESDEMRPFLVLCSDIPYDRMWDDDSVWLPRLLRREPFHLRFRFDSQGEMVGEPEELTAADFPDADTDIDKDQNSDNVDIEDEQNRGKD